MPPPPSRGIGVLVELAPLLGFAPIRLLLADVVLLLAPQHDLGGFLHQIATWLPGRVVDLRLAFPGDLVPLHAELEVVVHDPFDLVVLIPSQLAWQRPRLAPANLRLLMASDARRGKRRESSSTPVVPA